MSDENKNLLATAITLDSSLDDIEDLPQFLTFPSGAYQCVIEKVEEKEIGDNPCLEVSFKLLSTLEISEPVPSPHDPSEKAPADGDIFTTAYSLNNKFGVGNLKELLKPIAEVVGTTNIGEIVAQMQGMQVAIVIKRQWNKEKEKFYANVKKLVVA